MELICPSCDARYHVPDDKVGPDGRTVKCAKCQTRWFARLEAQGEAGAPPALSIDVETGLRRRPQGTMSPPIVAAAKMRLNFISSLSSLRACALGAGALAVVFLVVLGSLTGARDGVIFLVPKAAILYDMIGLPTEKSVNSLRFDRFSATLEPSVRGTSALKLSGRIINAGEAQAMLPPLKLNFMGKNKKVLSERVFNTKDATLLGEGVTKIAETFEDVPAETTLVVLGFAPQN